MPILPDFAVTDTLYNSRYLIETGVIFMPEIGKNLVRCDWANRSSLEQSYHDNEWGRPVHDDAKLFEMLILEGKQAGLSWSTILAKRETLRKAFDNFDPAILVTYSQEKIDALMSDQGIIRNRAKINAVVANARAYFALTAQYGTLNEFLWRYVDYQPIINCWSEISQVPAKTALSDQISKDLKKIGFKFVGSTTIYAFMQSIGMVNDHLTACFLYSGSRQ